MHLSSPLLDVETWQPATPFKQDLDLSALAEVSLWRFIEEILLKSFEIDRNRHETPACLTFSEAAGELVRVAHEVPAPRGWPCQDMMM